MKSGNNFKIFVILYGIISLVSQIVLMREFVVIFYGNELTMGIMLAGWLFWTATGSGILSKIFTRIQNPVKLFGIIQLITAIVFPATLYLNRISLRIIQHTTGEVTGLTPILLIPTIILSLYCLLMGILFTMACRIQAQFNADRTKVVGEVYILEAAGAIIGGLITSFILIKYLSSFQIAALIGAMMLTSGIVCYFFFSFNTIKQRIILIFSFCFFTFFNILLFSKIEILANEKFWQDHQVVETKNSIYGSLTLTTRDSTYSFFENGLLMFTTPDDFYAEESVHLALLEHPEPHQVLLLGGGISGSLKEILKHPSVQHIDYVELDPTLIQMVKAHLPATETLILNNSKISCHYLDGRFFLKSNLSKKFDVVIANLPAPSSTLLNRFYTREFFNEIKNQLNPGGIFAFRVTSAENYIHQPLAQFLSCLYTTLKIVFPEVIIIPGHTNHFMASTTPRLLTEDVMTLLERLKNRNIETQFINEYFLPFRMTPERINYLHTQIAQAEPKLINHDFTPIAYFFDIILWGSHSTLDFNKIFQILLKWKNGLYLLLIFLFFIAISLNIKSSKKYSLKLPVMSGVFSVGFSQIGLEVGLILAFQALYGYAYYQVSLILAGFMVGLTLGSLLATYRLQSIQKRLLNFIKIQLSMGLFPLFIIGILFLLAKSDLEKFSPVLTEIIFFMLITGVGFIGGLHFPLASAITTQLLGTPERAGGKVYASDLFGACLGAFLASSFLIPLFGIFRTFILYSIINLIVVLGLILVYRVNSKILISTP
ncbi:fused MFS/spermidine synthase [candidate division KSB1 bacterium]|nr:fused MFS/spermidine synthase [candidate division KSB1 bacterium]